mgnify:CR=1 FL=1
MAYVQVVPIKMPNIPISFPRTKETTKLTVEPAIEMYLSRLNRPEALSMFQTGMRMVAKKKLSTQTHTTGKSSTISLPNTSVMNGSRRQRRQVQQNDAIPYIRNSNRRSTTSTCAFDPVASKFPMLPLIAAESWLTTLVSVLRTMV